MSMVISSPDKQHQPQRNVRSRLAESTWSDNIDFNGNGGKSSSSWDQQTDRGSWSEDAEEASSRRMLEHWHVVERTLFDEEDQLHPGPLFDECLQWRNQLPHLRLIGQQIFGEENVLPTGSAIILGKSTSATGIRTSNARKYNGKLEPDPISKEASIHVSAAQSGNFIHSQKSRRQAKEEVLDHIVEFICRELAEIEAEKAAEELSDNFDEYLKIAPAPTCTGKNPLVSNQFYYNVEETNSKKDTETKKEREKEKESRVGRNKLGTIFNERIIVSPVPFVVTTRESFSTIRRTPIQFMGENDDVYNGFCPSSRRDNSKRKLSLTRKTPLIAAPHVPSSWNTPVCPTVWPKSVKLTPIDTSRLPSSKHRPSKTADSVPVRHSRNSLSPISHSVQPTSPRSYVENENHYQGLEIRGSHIVAQTPRLSGKFSRKRNTRAINRLEDQV